MMLLRNNNPTHYKRGFSLLELLIVIIIISVLMGFAIEKLMKLQVQAERSAMQGMIGILQSAIALTISEHIAKGTLKELQQYIHSNPMALLADTPVNYLGSFKQGPDKRQDAKWWFDESTQSLCYSIANQAYFTSSGEDKSTAKFKILAVYDDNNRNGRFDQGDVLKGLRLSPLAQYHWSNEPIEPKTY